MEKAEESLRATLDRVNEILEVGSLIERRQDRAQSNIDVWSEKLRFIETRIRIIDRFQDS